MVVIKFFFNKMYCKFLSPKFLVKVFLTNYLVTKHWLLVFVKLFSSSYIKQKKKFSYKKCFPNLIFCVYLFVWLSVCQCHCKYPSFRHQTKFRLKVLAPVLTSDDTILEIFHSNDLIFFPFYY